MNGHRRRRSRSRSRSPPPSRYSYRQDNENHLLISEINYLRSERDRLLRDRLLRENFNNNINNNIIMKNVDLNLRLSQMAQEKTQLQIQIHRITTNFINTPQYSSIQPSPVNSKRAIFDHLEWVSSFSDVLTQSLEKIKHNKFVINFRNNSDTCDLADRKLLLFLDRNGSNIIPFSSVCSLGDSCVFNSIKECNFFHNKTDSFLFKLAIFLVEYNVKVGTLFNINDKVERNNDVIYNMLQFIGLDFETELDWCLIVMTLITNLEILIKSKLESKLNNK